MSSAPNPSDTSTENSSQEPILTPTSSVQQSPAPVSSTISAVITPSGAIVTQTQVITTQIVVQTSTKFVGTTSRLVEETTSVRFTTTLLPGPTQTVVHKTGGLSHSAENGIIAGSVIGGCAALSLLTYLLWTRHKRRRRIRFNKKRPITFDDEKSPEASQKSHYAFLPAGMRPAFHRGESANQQPTLPNIEAFQDEEFQRHPSSPPPPSIQTNSVRHSHSASPPFDPIVVPRSLSPSIHSNMFIPPREPSPSIHSTNALGLSHSHSISRGGGPSGNDNLITSVGSVHSEDDIESIGSVHDEVSPPVGLRVMNNDES